MTLICRLLLYGKLYLHIWITRLIEIQAEWTYYAVLLTHAVSSGRQSFLFLNCIYFRGMYLIRAVREFYAFGLYIFANYALIIFLYSLFTGWALPWYILHSMRAMLFLEGLYLLIIWLAFFAVFPLQIWMSWTCNWFSNNSSYYWLCEPRGSVISCGPLSS